MDRKETTNFLNKLLEKEKLSGAGKYWAKEVTLDYGKSELTENGFVSKTRRIDYLQFVPTNQLSVDGIEKGEFICYEVKSCKADFLSGHGQNFVGEKNYLVMTMQTYKDLKECGELDKLNQKIGILIPIPKKKKYNESRLSEEYENPTPLDECDEWILETAKASRKTYRQKSIIELLFCMVRSGK